MVGELTLELGVLHRNSSATLVLIAVLDGRRKQRSVGQLGLGLDLEGGFGPQPLLGLGGTGRSFFGSHRSRRRPPEARTARLPKTEAAENRS